jgi:putative NADH-flavin reductase
MTGKTLKIAVFGASGHLGGAIAREALSRGHSVTGIARNAAGLAAIGAAGATIAQADILDRDAVERVVSGHDAVVASVTGRATKDFGMVAQAARELLDVLPDSHVTRLMFIGGGGSLEVAPGQRFIDSPGFPEQYRAEATAQGHALAVFRGYAGPVRWSYASPPPVHLVDGDKTGTYRVQASDSPVTDSAGESRISVPDYASAILDAIEGGAFINQRFTAGY